MNRGMILTGTLLLLAASGAFGQDQQKPATAVSAQGAAAAEGNVSAGREGAKASGRAEGAADAGAGPNSASLAQGAELSATLTRPVDAGKAKPGDAVEARAAKDLRAGKQVVVPRGSRLIGRVTQARPRGEGSAAAGSSLGIVFDRALLKDGRSIALNGAVTALGAAQAAAAPGAAGGASGGGSGGGSVGASPGGIAGTVGGTVGGVAGATTGTVGSVGAAIGGTAGATTRSAGAVGGFDVSGGLMSGSRGVFGLRDLTIASSAGGSAQGSVISSAKRNVRLESGTQMLIVAGARAAGQSADSAPGQAPVREQSDKTASDKHN